MPGRQDLWVNLQDKEKTPRVVGLEREENRIYLILRDRERETDLLPGKHPTKQWVGFLFH